MKEGGIESEEILLNCFQVHDSGRMDNRGEGSKECSDGRWRVK